MVEVLHIRSELGIAGGGYWQSAPQSVRSTSENTQRTCWDGNKEKRENKGKDQRKRLGTGLFT